MIIRQKVIVAPINALNEIRELLRPCSRQAFCDASVMGCNYAVRTAQAPDIVCVIARGKKSIGLNRMDRNCQS